MGTPLRAFCGDILEPFRLWLPQQPVVLHPCQLELRVAQPGPVLVLRVLDRLATVKHYLLELHCTKPPTLDPEAQLWVPTSPSMRPRDAS